ncbi:MAG: hypothetical protein LAP39_19190 [Acidobacteriia bacterium]|nr:hypothetical protein [Terriglobia bacterium]
MRVDRRDAVALLAIPLVIVAFKVESAMFATLCMTLAGAVIVLAVGGHDEFPWKHRIAICAFVFAADLGMLLYLYRANAAEELKQQVAPLVAAVLPQPVSSNCPIPRNAVALYLGNRVSVITEFPHVVFRAHGEEVLRIDRDSSDLLISFRVFNDSGTLVARLDRNTFTAANSASHVERPDPSHLLVFDDLGTKVLDVQFLNPQAINMTGILRYPGMDPIIVSEKYSGQGGTISPPACSTEVESDFEVK